jgi:hypothetical protein
MCFDLGQLEEYMDGESTLEQSSEISAHLLECHRCRERLEGIRQAARLVKHRLDAWMGQEAPVPTEGEAAWESIISRAQLKETEEDYQSLKNRHIGVRNALKVTLGREVKDMIKKHRAAATAAVVLLALGIALSFGPVRGAAANFLAVFRADQIKTVSLSIDDLRGIEQALQQGGRNIDLEQFGRVEIKEDIRYTSSTLAEAAKKVDFKLLQPGKLTGFDQPQVRYSNSASADLTLKVDNVNRILQSLKSQSLLPEELDQKTFTLSIPASVVMTCDSAGQQGPLTIVQSRSPELRVPDGVDIDAVRQALLGLPILPEQLKRQLSAISDWQHTLVVPDVNGSSQNVTVQGVPGVIMQNPDPGSVSNSDKCLVWIKDGVIYVVQGRVTSEQALEAANSLH